MFDWITGAIDSMGLFGVALFMFLENVFPPIPSELIMPLAGFNAARGDMNLIAVIIAGSIGSLLGAQLWYEIGRRIGRRRLRTLADRHGRWLTVSPDEFDQADHWFERHGGMAVLIGRLIPTVRTFISVPAGIARMGRVYFLLLSGIGTVAWTTLLAVLGYVLEGGYDAVSTWLDPVSTAVVVALIGAYLYRVATYGRRQRRKQSSDA
ncbi:MAG: DedA family protein [Celeribacter sp.]|jgi:membrane protein DedA with SNARE-associated domain